MEAIGERSSLGRDPASAELLKPEADAAEAMERIRADLLRAFGSRIRDLHALHPASHVRYAVFPALMAAGFALLAASLAGPGVSLPLYLPGLLLAALGMNSCFLLIHEAVHGILFRGAAANRLAGVLLAACGGVSFSAYRALHLRHHDYLGDPRDPDDYENYSRNPRLVWLLHFSRLALGTLLYLFAIPLLALKHSPPAQRRDILLEYAFLAAIAVCLFATVPAPDLAAGWLAPFLLTNWMINIRGFSQHGIAVAGDPYLASRTTLPHPVVQAFLINENFHLEHHLFPGVPGYHLQKLHALLAPAIPRRVISPSYSAFLLAFLRQAPRLDNTPIGLTTKPIAAHRADTAAGLPVAAIQDSAKPASQESGGR